MTSLLLLLMLMGSSKPKTITCTPTYVWFFRAKEIKYSNHMTICRYFDTPGVDYCYDKWELYRKDLDDTLAYLTFKVPGTSVDFVRLPVCGTLPGFVSDTPEMSK